MQARIVNSDIPMELKYCEWCGALWLRSRDADQPYCGACARWIEEQLPPLAQGRA